MASSTSSTAPTAGSPVLSPETIVSSKKVVHKIPLGQKLVVGGIAGVIGASATFPIDIVKTRLQAQVPNAAGVLPYKNPVHCFRSIVKAEGVAGLYKGLPPTLVGIIPEKAIKLAVNDYLRESFTDADGNLSVGRQVLAAAGAGTTQVIATNPLEIVKIRMQTQNLVPESSRLTAMQIVSRLGLSGMYRGTSCTLMRDVPYGMVFFPTYATLKEKMADKETGENSIFTIVGAGAMAGAMAAAVVTPADVIKTRLQMKGARFAGIADCYRTIVAAEGHGALVKGIFPRMMVQAPLFGITLVAFELQKQYMSSHC